MHAIVLQCGGPTAVVNTTLAALVRRWHGHGTGRTIFGGHHGLRALLTTDWRTFSTEDTTWLAAIEMLPGAVLGGGRDRLSDVDIERAVEVLRSREVSTVFLIGGNGTMAAGRELSLHARRMGSSLRVIGVPKTVDNDIPRTDLCPGFPSAARFLVEAVGDIAADAASMRGYEDVVLIETMGRHTGWLAAATALARTSPGDAPHVIVVPEALFDADAFLAAVRDVHGTAGVCVAVAAEGLRDGNGVFLAEHGAGRSAERDGSGQLILGRSGGPLPYLASLVRDRLRLRCRLVRPDLLQRCSRAHVLPLDRELASLVGIAAADLPFTVDAPAAVMIALRTAAGRWTTDAVPLDQVRGERTLPEAIRVDPSALRPLVGL
jgi:ATP-dependent phosphofructokinase / diphosphate-dependent phosphofructokinase